MNSESENLNNKDIILETGQGKLRGKITKTFNNVTYYSFQGIPYAKPPVGELRFLPPQPLENWKFDEILNAQKPGNSCYQFDLFTGDYYGSDDCLYLNVYTPQIRSDKLLPVMFWIHGGGFWFGSGNPLLYGPDFLIEKDVVLCTINYRLGALGFLQFKDTSLNATGNQGLKDQVEAMKWVKKHIHSFGGDANNVTIFGQSAGGASVHFHMVSPQTQNLFHKAIAQSGCSSNPWAMFDRRESTPRKMAEYLGFEKDKLNNEKLILDFLQRQNCEDLHRAQRKMLGYDIKKDEIYAGQLYTILPTLEDENPSAYLTETPEVIIDKGQMHKVPLINGFAKDESYFFFSFLPKDVVNDKSKPLLPKRIVDCVKNDKKNLDELNKELKNFYFKGNENYFENKEQYIKYLSDVMFIYDIVKNTEQYAKKSSAPIYLYRLNLITRLNLGQFFSHDEGAKYCTHCDELPYLFTNELLETTNHNVPPSLMGDEEKKYINVMTTLWTNFAKTSNPNDGLEVINSKKLFEEWKPTNNKNSKGNLVYLDINNSDISLKSNLPEMERVLFWDRLLNKAKSKNLSFLRKYAGDDY